MRKPAFAFRALASSDFRWMFAGMGVSFLGGWIHNVASSYLAWRLTHREEFLGVLGFVGQIAFLVFTPLAGALADRVDRRRLLIGTQIVMTAQASILGVLALGGWVTPPLLVALSFSLSLASAFDMPARQAFIPSLVDEPGHVPNAIALQSILFHGSRFVGPVIGGFLILLWGEGWCFLINAASFALLLYALFRQTSPTQRMADERSGFWSDLREGFRSLRSQPEIRARLFLVAVISILGISYLTLLPVFATKIFHGDARTQGFLFSAAGLGALCGAFLLAVWKDPERLPRLLAPAPFLGGLGLVAFGLSPSLPWALLSLFFGGAGFMLHMAGNNTRIQSLVEDSLRGRTMGLFSFANMGMAPFGALFYGLLASRIGAAATVVTGGVGVILAAAVFLITTSRNLPKIRT